MWSPVDEARESGTTISAEVGGPTPTRVVLHWRDSAGSDSQLEMKKGAGCTYVAEPALVIDSRVDYWIEAFAADGTMLGRAGSSEAPLTVEWNAFAPWCDEPCSCGGECNVPDPPVLRWSEPVTPRYPSPRRWLAAIAAGSNESAEALVDVELGLFVAPSTSVSIGARLASQTIALVHVRQFLRGRDGLALGVAAGGWRNPVAGAGLGYVQPLHRSLAAIVEASVLVGLDEGTQRTLALELGLTAGF